MIVGEGLSRRADLQKRIAQLHERLKACVLVQEGDEPPEDPTELFGELDSVCEELEALIGRINHTNAESRLATGESVTECLARRDVLGIRLEGLRVAVRAATRDGQNAFARYSRSEIRMVRQVSVKDLQRQIDELAKQQRQLDTELQVHNWTTRLIE